MAFYYITPGRCHLPSLLLVVFLSLGVHRIIAATAPPEVTNVTSKVSENSVTVSWEAPTTGNITDYRIIISNGTILTNMTTNTTSYTATSLSPGITYTITIYTVDGNSTSSGLLHDVTTLPSPVTNLKVTDVSDSSVTLEWTLSSDPNASSYTYTVEGGLKTKNTTQDTITMTDLQPGTDYSFTVYAVTSNRIYSKASNVVKVTTLPSPVTNLNVTDVSNSSVTLEWTLSSDPNASSYTYIVEGGLKTKSTTQNTITMMDLQPGTDYNFTVYAVTSNSIYSKASNVVKVTTLPSPVTNLNVTDVSDSSVTLVWTLSSDPNAGSYTYTVEGGLKTKNTTQNTITMTDLQPGTEYSFTVYAVTANEIYSKASNVVNTTTLPSPVANLTVISASDNSATLMWILSSDPNNHSYTYTVDGGGENKKTNITTNTVVMTNLQAGVDYNFTVFAVTSNRIYSESSNVVNVTTQPSIVQGVKESDVSETMVTLQWDFSKDINNKTYNYKVICQGWPYPRIFFLKNNSVAVENLEPGEDYNFTVFAVTDNGIYSQSSKTVYVTTMPNPPKYLEGNSIDVSEIYVNWSAPGDRNEKYYDYHVIWEDTKTSVNHSANTNDTHLNIKSLLPGHLYHIIVTSVIKETSSVEAENYTVTMPLSVEKAEITNINNNSATITWTVPNNSENFVSGCRVTVYLDGNKISSEKDVTENTCVVDGLIPGNNYTISVKSSAQYSIPGSVNNRAAAEKFIISYSTPVNITAKTYPDPVDTFGCSKLDAYQITVNFVCPLGNYTAFKVLVDNGPTKEVTTCPNDVIIPNLQPAISYKIRVMTVATNISAVTDVIICSTDNKGVIVGSIFGILLFFLLIALIVYFVKKRKCQKKTGENMPTTTFNTRRVHTIPKDKFKQHYETNHADSDFGFAEEYQELSSVGTTQAKRAAELPENRAKNRFINVLPYDHSRVKLSIMNGISTSDYINANYMPGYNSTKEFIASQGPLPTTTSDFWRMIWEHQVNTIVMLTNCMENGRVKCDHYWPLDYTPCTYGDITVTVTSETILSEWTIRDFSIKHANQPGIKYVRHFHFTAWPDHGVPDSTSSIIQFRNLVREYMDQRKSNGPTVVHCSAGVGRTGTLIALDYLMQQIEKEQSIGIYSFVEKMRIHRNLMVQTEEQYIFLNKCMVDLIAQPMDEHIYENNMGPELVYENINAIRNFQNENA